LSPSGSAIVIDSRWKLIVFHRLSRNFGSLKGCNKIAQGNALGDESRDALEP